MYRIVSFTASWILAGGVSMAMSEQLSRVEKVREPLPMRHETRVSLRQDCQTQKEQFHTSKFSDSNISSVGSNMDEYKASIDSVDSALARLNETLKSLLATKSTEQQESLPSPKIEEKHALEQNESGAQGDKPLTWGSHIMDMNDIASTDRSMQWSIRRLISSLRVDRSYPEVCTVSSNTSYNHG